MKKNYKVFFIVAFFVLSTIYIQPLYKTIRSNLCSSDLDIITQDGTDFTRTDYVDKTGKITVAADLGYATIIVTQTAKGKIERFYDEEGQPVSSYSGYYSVLHEYDEKGNNTRNTYYDIDGSLFTMPDGYTIETRTYDDIGRIRIIKYYDKTNMPVNTWSYGYGKINDYDANGNNDRVTYMGVSDEPMITKLGYASVTRNFYQSESLHKGKIKDEFYFDENNQPISLSIGQYGTHREYNENGQNFLLTYLDADGNPIITQKGYTTIKRTFYADGSIATEQYYDIYDKPFQLPEGQFGIRKEAGRTIYLNQEGNEIFNLRHFFYNQPRLVILIALVMILLVSLANRRFNVVLLIIIMGAIIYLTLFYRDHVIIDIHLEPFWSYKQIFYDSEIRSEIIKNIWLFIPLGAVLYRLYPNKKMICFCVLISIGIEICQYVMGKGLCEIDDVISNSLGSYIGFYSEKLTNDLKLRINSWKHIHIL